MPVRLVVFSVVEVVMKFVGVVVVVDSDESIFHSIHVVYGTCRFVSFQCRNYFPFGTVPHQNE